MKNDNYKKVCVQLTNDLYEKVNDMSYQLKMNRSKFIRRALINQLKQIEKDGYIS